jgi:hypothetical protein
MKIHKPTLGRNLITILLALSLLLSACGVEEIPAETPDISIEQQPAGREIVTEEIPTEEPIIRETPITRPQIIEVPELRILEPIIPETTKVLDNEVAEQQLLEISPGETADELVLVFSEEVLEDVGDEDLFSIDNIIAIDPTDGAPEGLLRKVASVSRSNGIMEVLTIQASLEEAIDTAEVHQSIELSVDERSGTNPSSGARLARVLPAREQALKLTIDEDLDGVRVTGTVTVQPSFDFNMIIQGHQLELLEFINTTVTSGKLEVESNIFEADFSRRRELLPARSLSPISIPIGKLFKMWFTPELVIYVGVDGNVSAGVYMAVSQDVIFNTGFVYKRQVGDFKAIFTPSLGDFDSKQPTFSADVEARAYLRPELKLKVFGVDGLFAGVDAYLKLEAGQLRTPWWEIFGGVRASVGIRVKIFSFALFSWEEPLLDKKWSLMQADIAAPVPTDTQPPPPAPKEARLPELVFGPLSGSLNHEIDNLVEVSNAGVDLRDFVAEAIFYTPYPTTKSDWDIGFLFRDIDRNDQFRLVIDSDGNWDLQDWRGGKDNMDYLDGGHLTNLDVSDGGSNRLKLIALGDQGVFFVNDSFIAPLDLSGRIYTGDIRLATELRGRNEIDDEVTEYEDFTIWSLQPIFEPLSGSLTHEVDDRVEVSNAGVDLRDFVAEAIFYTPYPTTKGGWDIGFLFRDIDRNDQFRLVIDSDGDWDLQDWRGGKDNMDYLDAGHLTNLDVSDGGSNRLKLIALGDQGVFFVNDSFIAPLDLSGRTYTGDIGLATELRGRNEIDGEVTEYEDFTIWSLP